MSISVTILGSNSALAAHGRHPSSQFLKIGHHSILVDCGEGSQFRMNHLKLSKMKIETIFISHLHGDHVYGLPGLVTSMILLGRKEPLTIVGPKGILKYMEQIAESTFTHFNFPIYYIETTPSLFQMIYENDTFSAYSIPLSHKVPCNGYLFREKDRPLNIREEVIHEYQLSTEEIIALKEERSIQTKKGILSPGEALYIKHRARSYAYCSDTSFRPEIIPMLNGVDVLYHEATYLDEYKEKAIQRGHSTTCDAATIAKESGVRKLLLGHPSSKYPDVDILVQEAKTIFEATEFAVEGHTYII